MGFVIGLLWFLLVVVMLVLAGIILLQEGKGGGLAEAFGGAGGETFGVKATGINRFTAMLGGAFLVLVVVINICMRWEGDESVTGLPLVETPSLTTPLDGLPVDTEGAVPADGN